MRASERAGGKAGLHGVTQRPSDGRHVSGRGSDLHHVLRGLLREQTESSFRSATQKNRRESHDCRLPSELAPLKLLTQT